MKDFPKRIASKDVIGRNIVELFKSMVGDEKIASVALSVHQRWEDELPAPVKDIIAMGVALQSIQALEQRLSVPSKAPTLVDLSSAMSEYHAQLKTTVGAELKLMRPNSGTCLRELKSEWLNQINNLNTRMEKALVVLKQFDDEYGKLRPAMENWSFENCGWMKADLADDKVKEWKALIKQAESVIMQAPTWKTQLEKVNGHGAFCDEDEKPRLEKALELLPKVLEESKRGAIVLACNLIVDALTCTDALERQNRLNSARISKVNMPGTGFRIASLFAPKAFRRCSPGSDSSYA